VVWGDSIGFNQAAWATHVVWGDSAPWSAAGVDSNHIVWGDTTVWVNHIVWGDAFLGITSGNHIVWGDANVTEANVAWQSLATTNSIRLSSVGNSVDDPE